MWEQNPSGFQPRVVLVGKADENADSPRNILGSFYSPDSTEICWVSDQCVRDAWLLDFTGDHVPDLPWTRVPVTTLAELQNSVESVLDYLSGQSVSAPHALMMDGDLDGMCAALEEEPTQTLLAVRQMYQSAGIPVTLAKDSDFLPCDDWAARRDFAAARINAGVTEIMGTAYASNRRASPAYLIQNQFQPYWDMSLVPTRQRIVVLFPGCDLGDTDRENAGSPEIARMFLTAPPSGTSAVFWVAHGRGAWGRAHIHFAQKLMTWRLQRSTWDLADCVFQAIRETAYENPGMIDYLGTVQVDGWPVWAPEAGPAGIDAGRESRGAVGQVCSILPNPARDGRALFRLELPRGGHVRLEVCDASGRLVKRLADRNLGSGIHTEQWDGLSDAGTRVPSGVYFARVLCAGRKEASRVLVIQ